MKKEIRKSIDRYSNLWKRMEDYRSAVPVRSNSRAFISRLQMFSRSKLADKNRLSWYSDEIWDSIFDCLACYRWYIIPDRLRKASGLLEETDIEILLDAAGYSKSLIAEELFYMLDKCLKTGRCNEKDLERIRVAYNGLSGFQDCSVCRIVKWGPVDIPGTKKNADEKGAPSTFFVSSPVSQAVYSA